jgi:hypothetical protein
MTHAADVLRDAQVYVDEKPSATFDDLVRDWREEGRQVVDSKMLRQFLSDRGICFKEPR